MGDVSLSHDVRHRLHLQKDQVGHSLANKVDEVVLHAMIVRYMGHRVQMGHSVSGVISFQEGLQLRPLHLGVHERFASVDEVFLRGQPLVASSRELEDLAMSLCMAEVNSKL